MCSPATVRARRTGGMDALANSELVPVDEFFLDYLEMLEDRGHSALSVDGPADGGGQEYPGQVGPDVRHPGGAFPQIPLPQGVGIAPGPGASGATAADSGNSGSRGGQKRPRGNSSKSGTSEAVQGGGSRYRSAKQQLLNKQAQQRYRERKKQRQAEMEAAVEELTRKVGELEEQQRVAAELRRANQELEKKLVAKEVEISRLRVEMRGARAAGPAGGQWCDALPEPSGAAGGAGGACAPAPAEPGAAGAEGAGKSRCAEKLNRLFSEQVEELRAFWERERMDELLRGTRPADPALEAQMLQRMDNICTTCMYTMRAEGIRSHEIMERDDVKRGKVPAAGEMRALWSRVVGGLALSPEQAGQILEVRLRGLQNLQDIYRQRQALNMRAISALAPKVQAGLRDDDGGDADMLPPTLVERHLDNHRVSDLLEEIKANLGAEQKAMAGLQHVVHKRILTPLQACKAVLVAYPYHCDTLALCNTLAQEQGVGGEISDSAG